MYLETQLAEQRRVQLSERQEVDAQLASINQQIADLLESTSSQTKAFVATLNEEDSHRKAESEQTQDDLMARLTQEEGEFEKTKSEHKQEEEVLRKRRNVIKMNLKKTIEDYDGKMQQLQEEIDTVMEDIQTADQATQSYSVYYEKVWISSSLRWKWRS